MPQASLQPSKRQYVQNADSKALALARSLKGAKRTKFPEFVAPLFPARAARPPEGDNWLHEINYDGHRFQCHIHQGIRFFNRRGYDWTDRLGNLVFALEGPSQHPVIFDGEVLLDSPRGPSGLHGVEKELKRKRGSQRLTYYVFDILYLGGFDLRGAALIDRRRVLSEVLRKVEGPVKLNEPFVEGHGAAVWRGACALGLKGIVSRRRDAPYRSGRSGVWVKSTCPSLPK